MADAQLTPAPQPKGATGVIVFADGRTVWGQGFGAQGEAVGELCFNTAMTGYQEVMTDPSYAAQIITFTFPHIGNVGTNYEDVEADNPHALGCIVREDVTNPSNFRSGQHLGQWMKNNGRIGISGVDTRALTRRIREKGAPNGVIAHSPTGAFDTDELIRKAREWPGLEGMDLAKQVSCRQMHRWNDGGWDRKIGYRKYEEDESLPHVVAIDYGSKRNIFRNLADAGARVTVVPATATFEDVMAHRPDGIFLSNGPGDPAWVAGATEAIGELLGSGVPVFGICLGHQLLGLGRQLVEVGLQRGVQVAVLERLASGDAGSHPLGHVPPDG